MEKIEAVTYLLKLPLNSKVHPVFHVSLLKKAVVTRETVLPLPCGLVEDWELQVCPEEPLNDLEA